MISTKAEYRREDFFFARQQSRHSEPLEKMPSRYSWLGLIAQIIGLGAVLVVISKFILWCYANG